MIKNTKIGGIAAALLAFALSASAEIKLNENVSMGGYIAGSNQYTSAVIDNGRGIYKTDSFDVDASKLLFDFNYKPVSGVVSVYYARHTFLGSYVSIASVLDAYATYDFGNGFNVSGGKFLSWLGYESFDEVNMNQLSYANGDFLSPIPGYHSGVRVEYAAKDFSTGVALLDSVYALNTGGSGFGRYSKGDGELRYNQGYEGYFTYKGVQDLTLFAGIAYESKFTNDSYNKVHTANTPSIVTLNFWASYQVQKDLLVAAEFTHKNGDHAGQCGYNWLFLSNYTFTPKFSTAFRVSGEHVEGYQLSKTSYVKEPNFTKFTVAPSYNVTTNLIVRAEVSYYNYANRPYTDKDTFASQSLNHSTYVGVQALFKF
jgi:hypothetical protein